MNPQPFIFFPDQIEPTMLHIEHSPVHRSDNLLCHDSNRRGQAINRGLLDISSHHGLRCAAQPTSPATLAFMVPTSAPDRDFRELPHMGPIGLEYYLGSIPIHCSPSPQTRGRHPTVDVRVNADAYDSFIDTPQSLNLNSPTAFGGISYGTMAAQQPSMPLVLPGSPMPPSSGFDYHPCHWLGGPQCDGFAPGRNREMGEHLRRYHRFVGHERDMVQCQWENCGQGMQRMNVPRHIVSRHLLAAASCRFCGRRFSRPDVVGRHERTCNGSPHVSNKVTARI